MKIVEMITDATYVALVTSESNERNIGDRRLIRSFLKGSMAHRRAMLNSKNIHKDVKVLMIRKILDAKGIEI